MASPRSIERVSVESLGGSTTWNAAVSMCHQKHIGSVIYLRLATHDQRLNVVLKGGRLSRNARGRQLRDDRFEAGISEFLLKLLEVRWYVKSIVGDENRWSRSCYRSPLKPMCIQTVDIRPSHF